MSDCKDKDPKELELAAKLYEKLEAEEEEKEKAFQTERKKHRDSFGFEEIQSLKRTRVVEESKEGKGGKKSLIKQETEKARLALKNQSRMVQASRYSGNFELPSGMIPGFKMSRVPPQPPSIWERK